MTIEEKLRQYALLKEVEKETTENIDLLKPAIREHLLSEGVDKLPTNLGTFSVSERTTWQYSPAVEKLQKEEKANGTAKALKSVVLLFKATGEGKDENV